MVKESYLHNVGFVSSMMLNALTGGKRGETFSSRCHRANLGPLEVLVDMFLGKGHCYRSYWRWKAAEEARWAADAVPTRGAP